MSDTINVNVADQAYPAVPSTFQNLPPNLGALLQASLFAPPSVPPSVQSLNIFTGVQVPDQTGVAVSPSLGFAIKTPVEVDLDAQNLIRQPVTDYIVTDVGNFQIQTAGSQITLTTVSVIDADTYKAVTSSTTRYLVTVSGPTLTAVGLSLLGRQVIFTGNVTATIAGFVRIIEFYGSNYIVIEQSQFGQTFSTIQPAVGDTMTLDTERNNDEVVFNVFTAPKNVTIDLAPPAALTVTAPTLLTQGNIQANSGVVAPFIGSGLLAPAFQGTIEVAYQNPLGLGLPGNAFPS